MDQQTSDNLAAEWQNANDAILEDDETFRLSQFGQRLATFANPEYAYQAAPTDPAVEQLLKEGFRPLLISRTGRAPAPATKSELATPAALKCTCVCTCAASGAVETPSNAESLVLPDVDRILRQAKAQNDEMREYLELLQARKRGEVEIDVDSD